MSNKQQTAVEWFANESWQLKVQLDNQEISVDEYAVFYVRLLYKAKEMEKEQTIEFAINYTYGTKRVGASLKEDFIKLYEQTYEGR
jgi:hypothetical protein